MGCRMIVKIPVLVGVLLLAVTPAMAQRKEPAPKELQGITVTEHLDAQIPLDLEFTNTQGKRVTLGQLFDGTRPVILTMNYSDCPQLCIVQLNSLVKSLEKMPWDLGKEYQVVTVSIDPVETYDRARLTRQKYLKMYGRPGGGQGWHFLVGKEANIKRLAETVGFGYRWLPESKQYVHAAVLMVCMPEGRVSRYLYGVAYDPQTLRLSMTEAAEGRVGTTLDQILLFCFHYDASSGRYGPAAFNLMRAGGALTVVLLGTMMSVYWVRERRKAKRANREETS